MRTLIVLSLFVGFAMGAPPPPRQDAAMKSTRHSFMLVSTRAVALFQAADTIEKSLQADGSSLHPSTITLRLRIERTLDQAQADIDKGDATEADEAIKKASEMVSRFARRIGGE